MEITTEKILEDIERGRKTGKILVSCIDHGFLKIPDDILNQVSLKLGITKVSQYHYYDSDSDVSYVWLKLGPTVSERIKELEEELHKLRDRVQERV